MTADIVPIKTWHYLRYQDGFQELVASIEAPTLSQADILLKDHFNIDPVKAMLTVTKSNWLNKWCCTNALLNNFNIVQTKEKSNTFNYLINR
jgi:hypothetical protein